MWDIPQVMRGRLHLIHFGALSIASGLFGMPAAVLLRIGANVFSSIYTMLANKLGDKLVQHMWVRKSAEI